MLRSRSRIDANSMATRAKSSLRNGEVGGKCNVQLLEEVQDVLLQF